MRMAQSMVYDSASGEVILFGGQDDRNNFFGDNLGLHNETVTGP